MGSAKQMQKAARFCCDFFRRRSALSGRDKPLLEEIRQGQPLFSEGATEARLHFSCSYSIIALMDSLSTKP